MTNEPNTLHVTFTKSEEAHRYPPRADDSATEPGVSPFVRLDHNALKTLSRTPAEIRVGNYIVLFGGRDLEGVGSANVNADGSAGEYFTQRTQLESRYTKAGALYVDWEHAQGEAGDDILGVVDWKTTKIDERGVFVERVLSRRNLYVQWIDELGWFDDGTLGTSSQAVEGETEKATDGEILVWPLERDTLTVSPMEPRMLSENQIRVYKSLGLTINEPVEPEPEGAEASASVTDSVDYQRSDSQPVEVKAMSEEKQTQVEETPTVDIAAIVAEAAQNAADQAVKAYQDKLAKEPSIRSGLQVTEAEEDKAIKAKPYTGLGEFLVDVKNAAMGMTDTRLLPLQSRDAMDEGGYSLNGALGDEFVGSVVKSAFARKAVGTGLAEGLGSTGGIFVGGDEPGGILARVYESGQLLQRVSMDGLSPGSNSMTYKAEDETSRAEGSRRGGIQVYWAAEAGAYTASNPTFREIELKLKKVVGLVYATEEMLEDSNALESYIMRILPEEMRFKVEDSILNGTGTGQPKGLLGATPTLSVAKETGQAAATIVSQNIMKMWARMWAPLRRNAIWLVEQSCEPQLMQLSLAVGTGGVPLYTPAGGLSQSPLATIFGRPVIAHESCQAVGTAGDIWFIDPTEYQMIEKGGIRSASSIHVAFTTGESLYRFMYRVDGQPLWVSALTPLSGGDTLSPYINLAVRA